MKNFEVLKQLPLEIFANSVFDIVKNECKTLEEFESLLKRNYLENADESLKKRGLEAFQELKCSQQIK